MKIEYEPIRHWILFFTPSMLLCVLPDWLGITNIKPDWLTFRTWFDFIVAWCFFGGIAYAVYAVLHNANLETNK
jgi:hypothetical protein